MRTARPVGSRHGQPAVRVARAREIHESGTAFQLSENGVWLVAAVPPIRHECDSSG